MTSPTLVSVIIFSAVVAIVFAIIVYRWMSVAPATTTISPGGGGGSGGVGVVPPQHVTSDIVSLQMYPTALMAPNVMVGIAVNASVIDELGNTLKTFPLQLDTGSSVVLIMDDALFSTISSSSSSLKTAPFTTRYGSQVSTGYWEPTKNFAIEGKTIPNVTALMQKSPTTVGDFSASDYLVGLCPQMSAIIPFDNMFVSQSKLCGMTFNLLNTGTFNMAFSKDGLASAESTLGTEVAQIGLASVAPWYVSVPRSITWIFNDGSTQTWKHENNSMTVTDSAKGTTRSIPIISTMVIFDTGTTVPFMPINGGGPVVPTYGPKYVVAASFEFTSKPFGPTGTDVYYMDTPYRTDLPWTTVRFDFNPAGSKVFNFELPDIDASWASGPNKPLLLLLGLNAMTGYNLAFELETCPITSLSSQESSIFNEVYREKCPSSVTLMSALRLYT